jgi:hypothetical protein
VFWLAGVAEVVAAPGAGAAEKVQGAGKATGSALLGLVGLLFGLILIGLGVV